MAKNALPRAERHHQILTAMQLDWQACGDLAGLTIAQIAHILDMSASQKLRDMVTDVVIAGHVEFDKIRIPGVCGFKCVYKLRPDSPYRRGGRVKEKRTLKINTSKGEQTMLWEMSE